MALLLGNISAGYCGLWNQLIPSRAQDGIYVNLYVPSRVSWTQAARCSMLQETDYPAGNHVTLTLTAAPSGDFTVYLRIPAWAGKGTAVSVNGRRVRAELAPGFFPVRRNWKTGDKIELEIDQSRAVRTSRRAEPQPGRSVARTAGHVRPGGDATQAFAPAVDLRQDRESAGGDWVARTEAGDIRLRPFGAIGDEVYQTYWEVTG